jgi:hypothetical protein
VRSTSGRIGHAERELSERHSAHMRDLTDDELREHARLLFRDTPPPAVESDMRRRARTDAEIADWIDFIYGIANGEGR